MSNASDPVKIVVASGNKGKIREIAETLKGYSVNLVSQKELAVTEAEETGLSFVENAILKARNAAEQTGLPAIADDSGIEVDLLNGEPGIYSARYSGTGATDSSNNELLLSNLSQHISTKPKARFQCLMVFMRHAKDPTPIICQGTWEGYIVAEPKGSNGFGYDPLFFVPSEDKTAAELPAEIKNKISHRGQALQQLMSHPRLKAYFQQG